MCVCALRSVWRRGRGVSRWWKSCSISRFLLRACLPASVLCHVCVVLWEAKDRLERAGLACVFFSQSLFLCPHGKRVRRRMIRDSFGFKGRPPWGEISRPSGKISCRFSEAFVGQLFRESVCVLSFVPICSGCLHLSLYGGGVGRGYARGDERHTIFLLHAKSTPPLRRLFVSPEQNDRVRPAGGLVVNLEPPISKDWSF